MRNHDKLCLYHTTTTPLLNAIKRWQCASAEIKSSGFGSTLSNEVSLNSVEDPLRQQIKGLVNGWFGKMLTFSAVFMLTIEGGWVWKSPKLCWRNIGIWPHMSTNKQFWKNSKVPNFIRPLRLTFCNFIGSHMKISSLWFLNLSLIQLLVWLNLHQKSPTYRVDRQWCGFLTHAATAAGADFWILQAG